MYRSAYFIYSIMIGLLFIFQSCKKEATLVASTQNFGYLVPQGNHPYDKTILDFYQKYGTNILYKFTGQDTYWTPGGYKNANADATKGALSAGYLVTAADTTSADYITKQLVILNKLWFGFYPDKFLKLHLPLKIMLCNSVDSVYVKLVGGVNTSLSSPVASWYNYDNICVAFGNQAVTAMVQKDSIAFAKKVNLIFMQSITARNLIPPTTDFTTSANYAATITTQASAYTAGIIAPFSGASAQADWVLYLQAMVNCTEATLNKSQANTITSLTGILNSTKDTNGRIRLRYNIIRNYFINTYGVDLQAIGNYSGR